ncbi:sensor histidine kinase [Paenibacillus aurantiacus]|uniref:histidine kinase n=1 Tax=Paenibacillus aurantiacus TaxID=1936118 RepID=A0ABV5KU01_9BACL
MSIRLKLLLSYAAMLIVPLLSIILISLMMVIYFRGDLQSMKGIYESTEDMFDNEGIEHISKELNRTIEQRPRVIQDPAYLHEIDTDLQPLASSLVIRLKDRLIYQSDVLNAAPALIRNLPAYNDHDIWDRFPSTKFGNSFYSFVQLDFLSADKEPGSVFVITKINPITYYTRKFFPILFVSLILTMIVTHVLLTYFMSKHIIRPLVALRRAVGEMKEGNLEYGIEVSSKDEIGQLGIAFEEMRLKLRESIQVQQQYEENRKELISNISHDLKTPITAIKGYVDGIMDGIADTPERNIKYMKTIAKKAEEMDYLINELFLYAKLDLNRLPFMFESVNFKQFILDWSEDLKFELEKVGISFHSNVQIDSHVQVSMDRDHFNRVLNNIIQNSMKYMDKTAKKIELTAYCANESAVLEITDNGQGIEKSELSSIFERFYRTDESRNSKTGGSGLGLAIAKQIMEGHEGSIEALSDLSIGTTIKLTIPINKKGPDEP